eukprot:5016246-Pyramimonas_sp.AAC.1
MTQRSFDVLTDVSCKHHHGYGDVLHVLITSTCTPRHIAEALNAVGGTANRITTGAVVQTAKRTMERQSLATYLHL